MLLTSFKVALGIQCAFGIPSSILKTEKLYDFSGALTHIAIVAVALRFKNPNIHQTIASAISIGWAVRLGGFLAYRMYKTHSDTRFDAFKGSSLRFFGMWIGQAFWCSLIQVPVVLMLSRAPLGPLTLVDKILGGSWLACVVLEAIADQQKWNYKASKTKEDPGFTHTGLWKYSQHPNYFFEISAWTCAWLFCCKHLPVHLFTIGAVSPLFTSLLLLKVSGIPLDKKKEKYGTDNRLVAYKENTSLLVPWFPKKSNKQD
eukprot:NODE_252_length_11723_cov_1.965933.p8 type:complete len:259 gc:universal NODE_252_length_11723_cov_1.965933:7006-7782(+)